ncbi:hypothetical protein LMG26842_05388 [Achromobacter dolens]|uniref:hypothetical protein n=1 Tax=Achromobacter dolens TaxID=1287738 RepID=UPI0014665191|nr:hypothetical protein [Achromobacter dolens]CAB3901573.1 hypothetical protein LMG26842_05388 [Achromobacter dolens]
MDTAVLSLVLFASISWALALAIGGSIGLWLLWRRRAMRKWIAAFDRGLEREERIRADFQRRHRFRS